MKLPRDQNVKLEDGWLGIKEEHIKLLYEKMKGSRKELKNVVSEYENIIDEFSVYSNRLQEEKKQEVQQLQLQYQESLQRMQLEYQQSLDKYLKKEEE